MENNKINIVELLRNCHHGMKLDCTMYDNLYFDSIVDNDNIYQIKCYTLSNNVRNSISLTKFGTWNYDINAKCVIFPKGKTTWEGFVPPCKFKVGDIISNGRCICIYNGNNDNNYYGFYVGLGNIDFPNYFIDTPQNSYFTKEGTHLATEEEKEKLFKAIKDNGCKWNPDTKTLEDLVEPKFKIGDVIQDKDGYRVEITEVNIGDECYYGYISKIVNGIGAIDFKNQDDWELVPNKFDITTLVPFETKVLVRDNESQIWRPAIWGYYAENCGNYFQNYLYGVVGGSCWRYCIPYEGNENLRGKIGDCDEFYKTWE